MSVLTRPAALLATAAVAAGLIAAPGAAYATGTVTQLTAAEMAAALAQVSTASATASAGGWRAEITYTSPQAGGSGSETVVHDPVHGRYSDSFAVQGGTATQLFLVDGRGHYEPVESSRQRAALKMMGRPAVTYVFTPDRTLDLAEFVAELAPSPANLAGDDYEVGGSRTAHDDGSAHYTLTEEMADATAELTLNVSAGGILTGVHASVAGDAENTSGTTLAYTYGSQTVTLPGTSAWVAAATLADGVAYLDMTNAVKRAVTAGAADTHKAANGGRVKVSTLRKLVRRDAAAVNRAAQANLVEVKDVTGGVRVYATNPWTKATVAYTVKASGKKVVVKPA
jgi:hypothetical protein